MFRTRRYNNIFMIYSGAYFFTVSISNRIDFFIFPKDLQRFKNKKTESPDNAGTINSYVSIKDTVLKHLTFISFLFSLLHNQSSF